MTKQTPSDRLRTARLDAGLTLQKVADKIGSYASTICCYEKGRLPDVVRAAELADAVGVRLYWYATGKGRRKL